MKTQYAIKKVGSLRKLAELLNISTQAVHAWGDEVPALRVFQLQVIRPDMFKPEKPKVKTK